MNSNVKYVCLLFVLVLLSLESLYGQDIQSTEKKYTSLAEMFQKEDSLLTVLKNSLTDKARQIDNEKKKSNPDKNKITTLMSNSINLSSQVEIQQKKVHNVFTELESVKHSLSEAYGDRLEKLQTQKKSAKNSQEINSLDAEILLLMGRKLTVMPYIAKLSSDPERIKSLDFNSLNDKEKDIYGDYLRIALSETENQLLQVNAVYRETEQVIKLQKKTRKFLQEAELERGMHPSGRANSSVSPSSSESPSSIGDYLSKDGTLLNARNTADMIQSQAFLYTQLNPERSSEILKNMKGIVDTSGKKFSLNGYYNLLKELKKSLEDYRSMLLSKTGTSK